MNRSEKLIQQLRSGHFVSDNDAVMVNRWPEIDVARGIVTENDLGKLLSFSSSERQPLKLLAINLLQPFATQPQVYEAVTKIWRESSDYDTRYTALWRMLDNPILPPSLHHEIFAFIRNDWPRFLKRAGDFYDEPANIITGILARLNDPQLPPSKVWVYLCVALSSPDKEAAQRLISEHTASSDLFAAEVAKVCLIRATN